LISLKSKCRTNQTGLPNQQKSRMVLPDRQNSKRVVSSRTKLRKEVQRRPKRKRTWHSRPKRRRTWPSRPKRSITCPSLSKRRRTFQRQSKGKTSRKHQSATTLAAPVLCSELVEIESILIYMVMRLNSMSSVQNLQFPPQSSDPAHDTPRTQRLNEKRHLSTYITYITI